MCINLKQSLKRSHGWITLHTLFVGKGVVYVGGLGDASDDAYRQRFETKGFFDMDTSDVRSAKELFTPLVVLILLGVLITFDLVADFWVGMSVGHFVLELCLIGASAMAARVLWKRVQAEREAMRLAHAQLEEEHAQLRLASETWEVAAEHWRAQNHSLVEGLSEAIDRQFVAWGLSDAESAVALLLLKGLALKEIAEIRHVSERTVREQARAIYRKAELANRSELAAFFLEDLLSPRAHIEGTGASKEATPV